MSLLLFLSYIIWKEQKPGFFFWIATTTNIKTKKFGICFIVTGWCNKRNFFSQLINLLKLYFFPTKTFIKSDLIRVLALAAKHICVLLHFLTWNLMHAQWGKMFFGGEYSYLLTSIRSLIEFRATTTNFRQKRSLPPSAFCSAKSDISSINGGFLPKKQEIIVVIYLTSFDQTLKKFHNCTNPETS